MGITCHSLNEIALRRGLARGSGREVNVKALGRAVRNEAGRGDLLYGHLLPHVLTADDVEMVVVLRCDPLVLKDRLASRGYSRTKVRQNVEAELIGLSYFDALRDFGGERVREYDTSAATPPDSAFEVARLLSGDAARPGEVDWLSDYDSPGKLRSLLS
jgi:adenylate kinase